jgi:glucan phosphoethanolaminetransferase (alkaline phosphatase superfamily)
MEKTLEIKSLLKQPSAWIPLAISLLALAMILGYVAMFGIVQHEDEGTPAHIFQLLMILQLPIIAYFALRWLPKRPIPSLIVLVLQAVAWIVPIAAVMWFEGL